MFQILNKLITYKGGECWLMNTRVAMFRTLVCALLIIFLRFSRSEQHRFQHRSPFSESSDLMVAVQEEFIEIISVALQKTCVLKSSSNLMYVVDFNSNIQ